MNQEAYERVKRHFVKGSYLYLENKEDDTVDKFKIGQLTIEDELELYAIWDKFMKTPERPIISSLDTETIDKIKVLAKKTLAGSSDFEGVTDVEKDEFIAGNLIPMFFAMVEANDMGMSKMKSGDREAVKRAESIRRIKDSHTPTEA